MTLDQIKKIVGYGESGSTEFKKSTSELRSAFETVCAFLNGDGGAVLIGVTDGGRILGQEVSDKTRKEIANEIAKLEPPAQSHISISYVPIDTIKKIVAIDVKPGNHKPYVFDGRPYNRIQSATSKMPQHRYEQLIVERGQLDHSWESIIASDCSISDLNHELIKKVVNRAIDKRRLEDDISTDDLIDILDKFHLLKNGQLTRAAVVLFCKNEKKQFIQSQLRLARFKGTEKDEFIDNKIYRGNIFYLYDKAMSFLNNYLPISGKIDNETPVRVDTPAIPFKVLRESIINALSHRDYSIRGGAVNIAVYDDRVEVNNAGGLPAGMTVEKLKSKHSSYPRNPLIAEVLHAAGYIEMWGRGIEKILNLSVAAGNPEPGFEVTNADFTVQLQLKEPILSGAQTILSESVKIGLSARQDEILDIIKKHGIISIKHILLELKNQVPQRTVQYDLAKLKSFGLIESKGKGRSLSWVISKKSI